MDIEHFRTRLRCLLLRILLIGPAPTSPPDVRCPASPAVTFLPGSARDHQPTRVSPVSVPEFLKTFDRLSLTRHFQRPNPPIPPRPHHAFRIPIAASPTLPPKYLLMWLSDVVLQPPVAITALNPPPPPLYPIYFAHTLKIGCRSTHSATVA